jgi:hypothetical protein
MLRKHVTCALSDAGVRGLTGNDQNWLETIPEKYRQFANTVFSDEAARELPPSRHGFDCEIILKEGAKLKTSEVYDMSEKQLKALKQLLDVELEKGFIRPPPRNPLPRLSLSPTLLRSLRTRDNYGSWSTTAILTQTSSWMSIPSHSPEPYSHDYRKLRYSQSLMSVQVSRMCS